MLNEALTLAVPWSLYDDLSEFIRKTGSREHPHELLARATREWLAGQAAHAGHRGYQWRELFLPEGTELRVRYRGRYFHAKIEGDELVYAGERMSPRDWCLQVTGSVRNPWRDIAIRRTLTEPWTVANTLRTSGRPRLPWIDRRQRKRRRSD